MAGVSWMHSLSVCLLKSNPLSRDSSFLGLMADWSRLLKKEEFLVTVLFSFGVFLQHMRDQKF